MYLKLLSIIIGFSGSLLASDNGSQTTQILPFEEATSGNDTQDLWNGNSDRDSQASPNTEVSTVVDPQETQEETGSPLRRTERIPPIPSITQWTPFTPANP